MRKIKSVQLGISDDGAFMSTNPKVSNTYHVDEIKEEEKVIGKGYYNDLTIVVYRGYRKGNLMREIPASTHTVIEYEI